MGLINLAPLLGSFYNLYFPMFLVILALFNVFNVYSRIVAACCIKKRFIFDESFNHTKIEQGKEILRHERELKEKGITSSSLRVRQIIDLFFQNPILIYFYLFQAPNFFTF